MQLEQILKCSTPGLQSCKLPYLGNWVPLKHRKNTERPLGSKPKGRGRLRGVGEEGTQIFPRLMNICVIYSQAAPGTPTSSLQMQALWAVCRLSAPRKLLAGYLPTSGTTMTYLSAENRRNSQPTPQTLLGADLIHYCRNTNSVSFPTAYAH